MTKALIFDLDNCLMPANEMGEQFYKPVFDAINQANRGLLSEHTLVKAFHDCWKHSFDWVADNYNFSSEMRDAAWEVFVNLEVAKPIKGYEDIGVLKEFAAQNFLVTSGFSRLQQSKITALGFEDQFDGIYIDAVDHDIKYGKKYYFEKILLKNNLDAADVLVIGDNAESEIDAGNRLGIKTIQTLRPSVIFSPAASFHIKSLREIKRFVGC